MRSRPRIHWVLICAVLLLSSSVPALSGAHLWRLTEVFSNADGTIQFIEMTTCCGSAGGEIFLSGHQVRSNNHTFAFSGNLDGTTRNEHFLLATSGYAALPGAPAPDGIIVDNFFSTSGDIINFTYDTMTFGAVPTDGTTSLNKLPDDATDTNFTARNSPTNLHDQTGSISAVTGPPGVPDGTGGLTPVRVASPSPGASTLQVSYDPATCANAANHHIVYGQRSDLPGAPGGPFRLLGSVCNIGNVSPYTWNGVPQAADGLGLIWFLVLATDANGVEGSWGVDNANRERVGPGNGGASGDCAVVKSTANACGHTP